MVEFLFISFSENEQSLQFEYFPKQQKGIRDWTDEGQIEGSAENNSSIGTTLPSQIEGKVLYVREQANQNFEGIEGFLLFKAISLCNSH